MSKEELIAGFEEYSEAAEVDNPAEEGDDTPNTSPLCSAIASAVLTNNLNC